MNQLVGFILIVAVFAVIFLILREFFTWYFKFNRMVELLEKIEKRLAAETEKAELSADQQNNAHKKCPHCGSVNPAHRRLCLNCGAEF